MSLEREFDTPQAAFDRLLAGNQRFVDDQPTQRNVDSSRRRQLTQSQLPYSVLFGCADSRVAAELIFDVGLGDMFVVRTAGHVFDTVSLGSIEYGVEVLGVPLVIVLGHDSCGAITAARQAFDTGDFPEGFISDLVARLLPSVAHANAAGYTDVNSTVAQNTIDTVNRLYDRSQIIKTAVDEGRTAVVGLTYQLKDGRVHVVAHHGDLTLPAED